jgi:hypothetical protein
MILFQYVVQVLHRSVSTAGARRLFLLAIRDRGTVKIGARSVLITRG